MAKTTKSSSCQLTIFYLSDPARQSTPLLHLNGTGGIDTTGCTPSFAKHYSDSARCAYSTGINITADGGSLVTGRQRDNPYVVVDQAFVARLDSHGNIVTTKKIKPGGPGYFISTLTLANGNLISGFSSGGSNNPVITLCLHDDAFNVAWQKSYGVPLQNSTITSMINDASGNIFISIEYSDYSPFPDHYAILKFSATGDFVWQQTYAMPNSNCLIWDQGMTWLNGFLYVATGYDPYSNWSIILTKVDGSTGSIIWAKQYQEDNVDLRYVFFKATSKNNVLGINIEAGNKSYSGIVLIDKDGNIVTKRRYSVNQTLLSLSTIMPGTDNGVIGSSVYTWAGKNTTFLYFLDSVLHIRSVKAYDNSSYGGTMTLTSDAYGKIYELYLNTYSDSYLDDFSVKKYNPDGSLGDGCPSVQLTVNDSALGIVSASDVSLSPGSTYTGSTFTVAPLALEDYTVNEVEQLCSSTNSCTTLKLSGSGSICNIAQAYTYTLQKSVGCTVQPSWLYDTAMASVTILSDTSVSVLFKKTGNIQLKAILNTGCTLLADSLLVNVAAKTTGLYLGKDTVLCNGASLLLKAGSQFLTYRWQNNSTDSNLLVTKAGAYSVTVTDACLNSYADTINILPDSLPGISLTKDTTKCNGDSIKLQAPANFTHYTWQPAQYISRADTNTVWVFPVANTQYTVTASKPNGCLAKETILVNVYASPSINLGSDTSICFGDSLVLDAGMGFTTYQWNTGAVSEKIIASKAALYMVKATAANGCSSRDSLSILNIVRLPVFSLGNDTTLCANQTLQYNFNIGGASYLWNTGATTGSQIINQQGTYWLAVTQQGCSTTSTVNVTYKPLPIVNLGSDTVMCAGSTKLLNATNTGATYLWGDGSINPTFTVTNAGTYYVTVTLNGCSKSDTITATYLPIPEFTLGRDTFICKGLDFTLNPTINTPVNYLWQDGSSKQFYVVNSAGTYTLTASNICGQSSDSIKITSGLCKLIMPNAFTPNGDGINDVFKVKFPFPVTSFTMVIFNRWGQKIYESADINKGWDGTFNGYPQQLGAYVWMINLIDADGTKESGKGTIMLIR